MPVFSYRIPLKRPITQIILAIALFNLAALLASPAHLSGLEAGLFKAIYHWPDWLRPLFLAITQLGSIYALVLLSVLVALKSHYHILLRLLLTGGLAYVLAEIAKHTVGRPRPVDLLSGITERDHLLLHNAGFPSGHTALVTAMALTVAHYAPKRYRWLCWLAIILVALSRMYLGMHAPLDIVGGFAIGWGCYALFLHVKLVDIRLQKPKLPKG